MLMCGATGLSQRRACMQAYRFIAVDDLPLAVHIHRWITKLQLNLQRAGETRNMKKNQPTLLTEGCI